MRRIRVTQQILDVAKLYHDDMVLQEAKRLKKYQPQVNLQELHDKIVPVGTPIRITTVKPARNRARQTRIATDDERDKYQRYVTLVMEKLNNCLLKARVSEFNDIIDDFRAILHEDEVSVPISIGGDAWSSLAERIVDAMQYDSVRKYFFPKYVGMIDGLKSCVYCNANYSVTDKQGRGYYDLDHWKPKSIYPYLCLCFFNLQPTCASCNRHKSADEREYMGLYEDDTAKDLAVMKLRVTPLSRLLYYLTHDVNELEIKYEPCDTAYQRMRDVMQDKLHIEEIYQQHKDVAEEVLWKHMAYNKSYRNAANITFGSKRILSKHEINRFILGTYDSPDDVHRRPMTQLIQDLAKDLGML